MQLIHSYSLIIHIFAGTLAALLFWAPMLYKKGSRQHRQFGRYYVNAMYIVAATGFVMAVIVIIQPLLIHPNLAAHASTAEQQATAIRSFWVFLLYLSLLTLTTIRHGLVVLKHQAQRQPLRQWHHLGLTVSLTLFGPVLALWGYSVGMTLLMIFGSLGTLLGAQMLRYTFKTQVAPKRWLIEHLSAMIGSGIAAYTAFFSFGIRRVFEDTGSLQLLSWVLPGIIGSLAIQILARKYKPTQPKA